MDYHHQNAPPAFETSTRWSDIQLWALGVIDAIDRAEVAFAQSMKVRKLNPADLTEDEVRVQLRSSQGQYATVWAANHLATSYKRMRASHRKEMPDPPSDLLTIIESLRDVMEHWDNERSKPPGASRSRSVEKLQAASPQAAPWSTQWSVDSGMTIANTLNLKDLSIWAVDIERIASVELSKLRARLWRSS